MSFTSVRDGGEALALVRAGHPFDVGLFDCKLPGHTGKDTAQRLRAEGGTMPLLLFTSDGRISPDTRATFTECFHKPFSANELHQALSRLFPQSEAQQPADSASPIHRPSRSPVTADPTGPSRAPLRILVAEDDAINRSYAEATLRALGHVPDLVEDGAQLLEQVERESYDVALVDIMMPIVSGIEAAERINHMVGGKRPYLIAATAKAMAGDRERILAAGFDDYIAKPFSRSQLTEILAQTPGRQRPPRGE
jgi:CheY-like chemotaxis protein